jgi:cytochrome c556
MKILRSLAALSLGLACRANPGGEAKLEVSTHPVALASASASASAHQALDRLDQRRPVPLLPMMAQHQKANMREHLEAVQAVVAASAVGDFATVALAAKRMGFSETTGRMCEHMGAGAPGFTEQALGFHHTADEIAVAAAKQDGQAVMAALSKTLRACTSCHATYKQQLVTSLPE